MLIPSDVALSLSAKLFELTPIPGTKQKHAREVRLYNEVIGVFSDLLGPYRFINTDSLAIPDAADFAKSVEAGFSEVLALGA